MFRKAINGDDSATVQLRQCPSKESNMLLSTRAFSLEFNSLSSFAVKFGHFDSHVQRPEGQPFWFFKREIEGGGGNLFGFGFHALYDTGASLHTRAVMG
jgi:hypothetical protein